MTEGQGTALRIAVLEDVPLFRQLIEQTIDEAPSTRLVASASTCAQARAQFPTSGADVILLDLNLPDGFGFDVGLEMRAAMPEVRIVVLSEHVRPQVLSALPPAEQPYWSYLLKTGISSRDDLVSALHLARSRPVIDRRVSDHQQTVTDLRMDLLSERQREILSLVAAGLSNTAIAERVYMSLKSVEYHLTQIYQQLEVATDASANARVKAAMLFADTDRA